MFAERIQIGRLANGVLRLGVKGEQPTSLRLCMIAGTYSKPNIILLRLLQKWRQPSTRKDDACFHSTILLPSLSIGSCVDCCRGSYTSWVLRYSRYK